MKHHETIKCFNCQAIELAEVLHTYPNWTYKHTCNHCGQEIQEHEWDTTGWLYNGDMMDFLYKMKDGTVDCVITDAPYGVRKNSKKPNGEEWDDETYFIENVRKWLNECLRVAKHTVIWFAASKMLPYILSDIDPKLFHRIHFWDKPAGTQFAGASHNNIWYSIECILVFTKDKQKTISYGKKERFNYDNLRYDTVAKKKWNHPTSKNVDLIGTLILHYSNENEIILDPFGGSGSLAEAAIKTNRKYIIVEKEEGHYNTILKRISDIYAQTDLFLG